MHFIRTQGVRPYSSADTATAWKNYRFIVGAKLLCRYVNYFSVLFNWKNLNNFDTNLQGIIF